MAKQNNSGSKYSPAPSEVQILKAIREDLQEKVAPELTSDMAKDVCRMVGDLVTRLILNKTEWPGILQQQITARAGIVKDVVDLLESSDTIENADKAEAEELLSSVPHDQADLDRLQSFNLHQAGLLSRLIPQAMNATIGNQKSQQLLGSLVKRLVEAEECTERSVVSSGEADKQRFHQERQEAELSVSKEQLQDYLTSRFPDKKNIVLTEIRELSGGFGKTTILFEAEGLENQASSLVIRRDRRAGATESTVADEFPLLKAVEPYGLPSPEVLWLEPDGRKLGMPFIVVRQIEGRPAGSLWAPDPEVCDAETALDLARVMGKLHSIPLDQLNIGGIWETADPAEAMDQSIKYITDVWSRAQQEPDPVMDACLRWIALNRPPTPERIVLVHSDIGFHNLLVKDHKISGLLDWELSHPGDPNEDLCYVKPYIEKLLPWSDFLREYQAHGGCAYLEDREDFYAVWKETRNSVFTALCHKGFCTDMNTDVRFGHTGVCYYRMMVLDAARRVAALV